MFYIKLRLKSLKNNNFFKIIINALKRYLKKKLYLNFFLYFYIYDFQNLKRIFIILFDL